MKINEAQIDPKDTIQLLEEWKRRGIPESEFREIHPMKHPIKTFERFCKKQSEKGARFRKGGRKELVHWKVADRLNSNPA